MNKQYIRILFRIVFAIVSIYSLSRYYSYKRKEVNSSPISYRFLEKIEHKGGRGSYYQLKVQYNSKDYIVDVTSNVYESIDDGKYPSLYYSESKGKVYSDWTVKVLLRVGVLFAFLFASTFVLFRKNGD